MTPNPAAAASSLFAPEELELLLENLDLLSEDELVEVSRMADELDRRRQQQLWRDDLIEFCKHMQADYKVGRHHRILANKLMAIESGAEDRVCVNMPPRHGKSQLVSIYYPAWFLGRNPGKRVMMVSHTADLAVDFGRKVRNIIDTPEYREVFPSVTLSADSKSAGRWDTSFGGGYYATGVGSSLAGRGADLLIVDDPHSEQDVLAGNFQVFEKAYDWFRFGARTRLAPGGRIAVVQCMTGDTPVLMADGVEKPLRDVRPGDMVASYARGRLVEQAVVNHRSNGVDYVFAIHMTSGIVVRANARHPFLVMRDTGPTWVRLRDLRTGDTVVSLRAAPGHRGPLPNAGSAKPAKASTLTTESTQMPLDAGLVTTGSGVISSALLKGVQRQRALLACAVRTIITLGGRKDVADQSLKPAETPISKLDTVSLLQTTMSSLRSKAGFVLSASSRHLAQTLGRTGTTNSVWIIATTEGKSGGSFATTATSQLDTPRPSRLPSPSPGISDFTLDTIREIVSAGEEEVFDIQVATTENFIANGLVSHNTRWHLSDLTGRLTRDMAQDPEADQYDVVEFPAIFEVDDKDELTGLPLIKQKPLWPEFFDLQALLRTKASMPVYQWNAQYQQNPTAEEAALVKREWWREWTKTDGAGQLKPPPIEYMIMSLDSAAETHTRADFTALTTWGVFQNPDDGAKNIILLNSIKRRVEFPELKQLCLTEYRKWEPDAFIVEKKSSGVALFQELRRTGLIVQEYTPHRGTGDKTARLNSVSDIIRSGLVWVPQTRWAEELVDEIAGFPFAENDDLVDSAVMALMRFRQGGFVTLPSDELDDPLPYRRVTEGYY